MRKRLLNCKCVSVLVLWMAILSMAPSNAFAFPSQSLSVLEPASLRDAQINQIMSVLSRPEAQLHLRMMGMNQTQVKDALAKLDDAQLAQVADKANAVKAVGDGLGIVIVILVIVLLFVVIVKLMDKRIEIKDQKK